MDECRSFTMKDLDVEFKKQNDRVLKRERLAGYALWKPYIIYRSLLSLNVTFNCVFLFYVYLFVCLIYFFIIYFVCFFHLNFVKSLYHLSFFTFFKCKYFIYYWFVCLLFCFFCCLLFIYLFINSFVHSFLHFFFFFVSGK
jgi:hypothetical protein